jgi:hypothetical protein
LGQKTWTSLKVKVLASAIGSNGTVFVINDQHELYVKYPQAYYGGSSGWAKFTTSKKAIKVTVDRLGRPWYIEKATNLLVFNEKVLDTKLKVKDLSIGEDGTLWVINEQDKAQ